MDKRFLVTWMTSDWQEDREPGYASKTVATLAEAKRAVRRFAGGFDWATIDEQSMVGHRWMVTGQWLYHLGGFERLRDE